MVILVNNSRHSLRSEYFFGGSRLPIFPHHSVCNPVFLPVFGRKQRFHSKHFAGLNKTGPLPGSGRFWSGLRL